MKRARVLALISLASLFWLSIGQSETNSYYYRSQQTGNWNDTLTWQWKSYGQEGWSQASLPPSGSEYIVIRSGHTVTLTQSITVSDLTVEVGGQLTVAAGQTLTVTGGGEGGALSLYGTLLIKGTLDATGESTYADEGSSVIYAGSVPQTVAPITYYDLQINNPAGTDLVSETEADGSVNVSQGNLRTGSNTLTLSSSASITETAPYAVLGMLYTSRACSLQTIESFGGMGLTLTSSQYLSVDVEVTRVTGTASTIPGEVSIRRYFDISATGSVTNITMEFDYRSNELNGADESGLRLFKSTDGGSNWSNRGGVVNTSSHSITLTGINAFSRWTAASVAPVPTLTNVSPTSGSWGSTLDLTLTGTNFGYGANTVSFSGTGITVNTVKVNSSTKITANVTISASAPLGLRHVSVWTDYGTATLPNSFTVGNPAPTLTSVAPTSGGRGQSLPVTLQGGGFVTGLTSVSFGDSISVSSVVVGSDTSLAAQIAIASGAIPGTRNVSVTNSGPGGGSAMLPAAFSVVNPAPTIATVSPDSGAKGQTVDVTVAGTGFLAGVTSISFGADISTSLLTVVSGTQLTVRLTISSSAVGGFHTVSVTNIAPGGGTGSLTNGFKVSNPVPTVTSVNPTSALPGQSLSLAIVGTNFAAGQTSVSLGSGITINSVTVTSPTQLNAAILVTSSATAGSRNVIITVQPPGGGSATLAGGFIVNNPAPTLVNLSATSGARGQSASLLVNGTGFIPGATTISFGSGITVGSVTVSNPNQMFVNISVAKDATLGSRDVGVINPTPGGGTATLPAYFTVVNPFPSLTGLTPNLGVLGQMLTVTLSGTDFLDGVSTVSFGTEITVNSATTNPAGTQITAGITIAPNAASGSRNVVVTNAPPGGGAATLTSAFNVVSPSPTLTGMTPTGALRGDVLDVTFVGTNFIAGVTTVSFGDSINVNSLAVNNLTQAKANITIKPGAATGPRAVTVTNPAPGGGSSTLISAFTVGNPAPTVTSVSPATAGRGSVLYVTILGTQFISGVTSVSFGLDITVNSLVVKRSTELQAYITIAFAASTGSRTVTVTNAAPGGGSANLASGFTVSSDPATAVDAQLGAVPDQYVLQEAYPNPFNPSTKIRYGLPEDSRITLDVHNMLGNVVAELVNGERSKGTYELQWHADNLPSGVYLVRIHAESIESARKYIASRKVVLVK